MSAYGWARVGRAPVILVEESKVDIVHASSVSEALNEALYKVQQVGIREESRNGAVLVMPTPVTTVYYQPQRRVLFSPMRDANPFFHLMESLWMLGGRNDLLFPLKFNSRFREYSDDGSTIWGAYGWRWRKFFGYDQLECIIRDLKQNPNSRRAVLAMWNAADMEFTGPDGHGSSADLFVAAGGGKDVPCNTHAYFDCRGGVLNMTVCNRSNDMLWGCYGANAVHFSILQEYMAARIGIPMGVYRQMSNNLHLYTDIVSEETILYLADDALRTCRYTTSHKDCATMPLVDCGVDEWHYDLNMLLTRNGIHNEYTKWNSKFIGEVAVPMYLAHDAWRNKQYDEADEHVLKVAAWDWRIACKEWLDRRTAKRAAKEQARG